TEWTVELIRRLASSFIFFNATPTTEIYTLSLHDALPIWRSRSSWGRVGKGGRDVGGLARHALRRAHADLPPDAWARRSWLRASRSEEHTSELQSRENLVCRLLLEKKKKNIILYQQ